MDQNPQAAPAPSPAEIPVESGLLSAVGEVPAAPAPEPSPIDIVEQPAQFDIAMTASDQPPEGWTDPAPAQPPEQPVVFENARQKQEREWHEEQEARRRAFVAARMKANEPAVVQKPAPFVSKHVAEQTRLEMEAGRKMNEHHAGLRAIAPQRQPDPAENGGAKMVPVFRPSDYTQPSLKTPAAAHAPTRTAQAV